MSFLVCLLKRSLYCHIAKFSSICIAIVRHTLFD